MFLKRPNTYSSGSLLVLAIIALILSTPRFVSAQTTSKVPLTHESMWMLKRVGAPIPSPDGKWVVFSLIEPAYDEKEQVSDLWIVPSDGSAKPRRLTFGKGGESGVAWSSDSRRIAFSARREGDEVNRFGSKVPPGASKIRSGLPKTSALRSCSQWARMIFVCR
jgi:WD40-like Beta Propeller Repeat